jgi:hypothetical protein
MLSQGPIYEVVTGQIRLGKQEEFFALHRDVFLPLAALVGIEPSLLLVTEVGRYLRFVDVYRYDSLEEYRSRTDRLLSQTEIADYYDKISECIVGHLDIELAVTFPGWHSALTRS